MLSSMLMTAGNNTKSELKVRKDVDGHSKRLIDVGLPVFYNTVLPEDAPRRDSANFCVEIATSAQVL